MRPSLKIFSTLALCLLPLAGASAQGMGPGGQGNAMMMGPGRILAAVNLPTLKTDLGITAAQEPQWATYEKAFTALIDTQADMQASTQDLAMTKAERMDMRSAHWDATVDLRTDLQKARDGLVGVLSPAQITILNQKAPALPLTNGPAR
ncbi:hypothetical protein Rru_A3020 [Rhodospirillum rubrum ATCC 11170]|uniref:LTXXQ motif family protein n=2 Tax=Rhodospirillum rubrum TaxID=1085 RepID=Q2RPY0_RHORT|nr:hypothetical protein Rru_A3020 [Rhodospirillum rubrum ATCC 11170]MBK5955491.1 hypothetical protein [Rhodospirillum rubrum]HAQ00260.1 hypothetical protein [Rhodospirillum rubrum]HCF17833.1 hypothetical protein [Rhodospirillum rubrum]